MQEISIKSRFDYRKATQAIGFFAEREGGKRVNRMKIIKLIWLADRYHLRKYGRLITGDQYYAMKYGPVASVVKEILEQSIFLDESEKNYSDLIFSNVDEYHIKLDHKPNLKVFSETDLEALNFAYKNFGKFDQFKLADFSHLYPEWKNAREKSAATPLREKISTLDFFENSNLEKDLFESDPELLELNKISYIERSQLESKWSK